MTTVTDWDRVMAELKKRGLFITTESNCNTIASAAARETIYYQWTPRLAMWAIFEPDEMDRFVAFLKEQERRSQGTGKGRLASRRASVKDGQHV